MHELYNQQGDFKYPTLKLIRTFLKSYGANLPTGFLC